MLLFLHTPADKFFSSNKNQAILSDSDTTELAKAYAPHIRKGKSLVHADRQAAFCAYT
jgi:hypothetical protein